jgi:hypothetical protein
MPHYHFDLLDGEDFIKDEEGMELLDIESAQIEAAEYLADMVKDLTMRHSRPAGHPMSIKVRDVEGLLFSLSFAFIGRL